MLVKEVQIVNETGLHARPATEFVKQAKRFQSNITVCLDNKRVNAKSLIHVLTLGADKGMVIEICADGSDEQDAIAALIEIINTNFEEPSLVD